MELKQLAFLGLLCVFGTLLFVALLSRRYRPHWGIALLFVSLFVAKDINLFFQAYRGTSFGLNVSSFDVVVACLFLRHIKQIRWGSYWFVVQVLFLLWASIGLISAANPMYVLFELSKYTKVLFAFIVFEALLRHETREKLVTIAQCWAIALALLQVILGLKQYISGVYRLNGAFPHSNDLSIVLNMYLPLLFALLFVSNTKRLRRMVWLCFCGAGACIVMTRSRAGWATMVVGLFLTFGALGIRALWFQLLQKRQDASLRRWVMVCSALCFFGVVGVAKFLPSILARIEQAPKSSAESRKEHNKEALIMAKSSIVGVGLNNYVAASITQFNKDPHGVDSTVAHHLFYLTAAETGFLGLFIFLLFPLGVWWMGLRALLVEHGLLTLAMSIGMCMAMLQSLFEPVMRHPKPLLLWIFGAAWVVASFSAQAADKNESNSSQ